MKFATRLGLAACVALGAITPASANHAWGNYHWARTANPLTLRINTALTGSWPGYVGTAVTQWNGSTVLAFTTDSPRAVSASAKRCTPMTGEILVCNGLYGQRGWLGIASITADANSHITSGTTKLNDTYFNTGSYNDKYWRAMVACQEIGHDFGLAHTNETFTDPNTGSCMDYTNDPSGQKGTNGTLANTAPDQDDMNELGIIYGHFDSTNTSASAGAAATNFGIRTPGKPVPQTFTPPAPGDTAAEWGTPTHRDGKGRPDQFIRQLGNGHKMITHVFWAPDAKGTEAN